jgi:hypothetical protein
MSELEFIFLEIGIGVVVFITIAILAARRCHDWKYHSEVSRSCKDCKRYEAFHMWGSKQWWEAIGTGIKGHPCSRKDAE